MRKVQLGEGCRVPGSGDSVPWWTGLRKEVVHQRRRGGNGRHFIIIRSWRELARSGR